MDKPRHPESGNALSGSTRWSDESLLAMVRAAGEVDELHEGGELSVPQLRLAGTAARASVNISWRWLAAAAALVAIGVMIFTPRGPSVPSTIAGGGTAVKPPSVVPLSVEPKREVAHSEPVRRPEFVPATYTARPGDAAVILTISQDADGRCRCVTSVSHQLAAGQTVGDLATSVLLGVGLQRLCEATPERVLVLGMSGPRELLPSNKAEAERFASCLDHGPGQCDIDASCFASSALACVSPSVNIVAETVAMRR